MTIQDIEQKNYTYCSAVYEKPELRFEKFLVPSPFSKEAYAQAMNYATAQWGEPSKIHIYPRNYVKKARDLFAAGRVA